MAVAGSPIFHICTFGARSLRPLIAPRRCILYNPEDMSDPHYRVGLAGWGLAGRYFHAPFIRETAGLHLTHVWTSRVPDPHLFGDLTVLDSFDDLLAAEALDLLVLATPNRLHAPQALAALAAGKHVVVEKPAAESVAAWEEVVAAAEMADRLLIPFHNRRWDGDFRTVEQLVHSDLLGPVHTYVSRWPKYRPVPKQRAGWKGAPDPTAGVLYDLGSHLVDQVLHLFGMPASVSAQVAHQRPGSSNEDLMRLHLTYEDGLYALLEVDLLNALPGPRFHLRGQKGTFEKHGLDPQEDALRAGAMPAHDHWGREAEAQWGTLRLTAGDGLLIRGSVETLPGNYATFYRGVYEALARGAPPPVAPGAATRQLQVLEAARRSAASGRVEQLEDPLS